jgi:hypothetical protein
VNVWECSGLKKCAKALRLDWNWLVQENLRRKAWLGIVEGEE